MMAYKLTMAICFLLLASVMDVQAMPGGLPQRASNPDLSEAAVRVPVTTPRVNGIKLNPRISKPVLHSRTMGHPGKPIVNGVGPVDPLLKSNATK
jgi:hypothetical protein